MFRIALTLAFGALVATGCTSNATKPDVAADQAPAAASGTATAPAVEGGRIEGVKLSPEVIAIAKTEGKVDIEKDKRVNCEKYKPIGSHRTQYRCRTVGEEKESSEEAQRSMRKLTTPGPAAQSNAGGSIVR